MANSRDDEGVGLVHNVPTPKNQPQLFPNDDGAVWLGKN